MRLSDKPLIWCGDLNVRLAFFLFFFICLSFAVDGRLLLPHFQLFVYIFHLHFCVLTT